MNRMAVTSKNLASVGYESASMTLEVEFLDGRVYQYFDVPEFEYRSLMQAGSHGTYFNANIKEYLPIHAALGSLVSGVGLLSF